jgi:hypothetical protein
VNSAEAIGILARKLELPEAVAANTYKANVVHRARGLSRDAALSLKGVETVIELRGRMGFLRPPFPRAGKYADLSFYAEAGPGR